MSVFKNDFKIVSYFIILTLIPNSFNRSFFEIHAQKDHSEIGDKLSCSICGKVIELEMLSVHQQNFHIEGKYSCKECSHVSKYRHEAEEHYDFAHNNDY